MNNTLDYYNENAATFVEGTKDVDFKQTQDRFIKKLNNNSKILDFGCGSGRDAKYFIEKGFVVDAIDGSKEICKIASEYLGIEVKQMLFQQLNAKEVYDGIWACSSILHLTYDELIDVLFKMMEALKSKGVIYTSFKYGDFEGFRNGRYFINFDEEKFNQLLNKINGLEIEELWISGDVREGRGDERWLNLILRKKN